MAPTVYTAPPCLSAQLMPMLQSVKVMPAAPLTDTAWGGGEVEVQWRGCLGAGGKGLGRGERGRG